MTKSGTLRAAARVDLIKRLMPAGAKGNFRLTMAVQVGKDVIVINRDIPDVDMARGAVRFRTPVEVPQNATTLMVVIEETTTGVWGSARHDIPAIL